MLKIILCALSVVLFTPLVMAADKEIKLPEPELKGGIPLMEAISARKTSREFSPKKIEDTDLSNILYSAWGISHDNKRTIPTALNKQDLNVYVFKSDGTWKYNAEDNTLIKVTDTDLMPYMAKQEYVNAAPLILIFTGKDLQNASMNAAAAYQNVGLYCASRGLNNVVRGYIEHEKIAEALNLKDEKVIVSQVIGWPYL